LLSGKGNRYIERVLYFRKERGGKTEAREGPLEAVVWWIRSSKRKKGGKERWGGFPFSRKKAQPESIHGGLLRCGSNGKLVPTLATVSHGRLNKRLTLRRGKASPRGLAR